MEHFVELLSKEWGVLSQAPFAFVLLSVAAFELAYLAARWKYSSVVEQVKASNQTLNERLHLKSEQAEGYKERALKYDEKIWAVVESDFASLASKALSLVSQIRDFIDRHRRMDDSVNEHEWADMVSAADEEERQRRWHRFTSSSTRLLTERNAEWERRFKIESIMRRDELRSSLKDYRPEERVDFVYEYQPITSDSTRSPLTLNAWR